MKLKICSVSDRYINYIRKFDNKVYDNKENKKVHSRKYVGIVLTINSMNYYIPMSSPKKSDYIDVDCKKIRHSVNTIIRMVVKNKEGKLELRGTLRISNMIPVPIEEIKLYDINEETDIKYKEVIRDEISFLRNHKNEKNIISKANLVYKQKRQGLNITYC